MVKGGKGRKWTTEQDSMLCDFIKENGVGRWDYVAQKLGIGKTGNSCRQRWYNHLDPSIARTDFTDAEEIQILSLHHQLGGNKWSEISRGMPGRTDNAIKNYWNTHLTKKAEVLHLDVASLDFLHIMIQRHIEKMGLPAPPVTSVTSVDIPLTFCNDDWDFLNMEKLEVQAALAEWPNCDVISQLLSPPQIDHGGRGCTNCYVSDPDFCTCYL